MDGAQVRTVQGLRPPRHHSSFRNSCTRPSHRLLARHAWLCAAVDFTHHLRTYNLPSQLPTSPPATLRAYPTCAKAAVALLRLFPLHPTDRFLARRPPDPDCPRSPRVTAKPVIFTPRPTSTPSLAISRYRIEPALGAFSHCATPRFTAFLQRSFSVRGITTAPAFH